MRQIPAELHTGYISFIDQRGVPTEQHRFYLKWLRYYLDYCHKYRVPNTAHKSLSAFLAKLKEKKQAENLRNQAHKAISLFYEMKNCSDRKIQKDKYSGNDVAVSCILYGTSSLHTQENTNNQVVSYDYVSSDRKKSLPANKVFASTNTEHKQSGFDWSGVFNGLKNCIKIRHYSPKTLKTYSSWVRKLQSFTKSKDPQLLSVDDVKDFLTWLAVEQGVSASSQNQAFNALLFLFRNVFKKEFVNSNTWEVVAVFDGALQIR